MEALRLGLVGSQSENFHSGFRAYQDQWPVRNPQIEARERGLQPLEGKVSSGDCLQRPILILRIRCMLILDK
jgi:hypothetical protein